MKRGNAEISSRIVSLNNRGNVNQAVLNKKLTEGVEKMKNYLK